MIAYVFEAMNTLLFINPPCISKIYRLLNSYSVLGPSFFGQNSIRPKNEVPKHCMSSITELLYTSIKLSI